MVLTVHILCASLAALLVISDAQRYDALVFQVYVNGSTGVQPKQWSRLLSHWKDKQRPIYNLCWRIPALLKKASPLHFDALITCTQKNGPKGVTDKTYVELFFHRELYTSNTVTDACMNELAQNLSALLTSGIPPNEHRVMVHPGVQSELSMINYRIHAHPVISLQEDNDDDSGADYSYFDEKFFFEIQADFETNWIPKLVVLNPEHPLAVQLNTDKSGSRIQITSNDVTFDVFYDGSTQNDHPMFLTEIVASINRQNSTYLGDKSYIDSVKRIALILPPNFEKNISTLVSGACPVDKTSENTYEEHYVALIFQIQVNEDILTRVQNQWNIFLEHWGENRGRIYDLCWRIPAVLEKASASHYNALLTCTQLWGTPTVSDRTRVELFFDSKLYTNSPVTPSCMSEIERNLTSILNGGINHTLWRDVNVRGIHNDFQLIRYRISSAIVMDINMDVEASTDEFEEYDEDLYLKLQNDFNDYWVPKLNILHPEHPIVVQLNLGKYGSGPRLTSNNVSFDVYYHGTQIQNNRSVLEEIVHNINLNRRQYIYTGTSAHIHAVTRITPILPPAYDENTPVAVPSACPRNRNAHW